MTRVAPRNTWLVSSLLVGAVALGVAVAKPPRKASASNSRQPESASRDKERATQGVTFTRDVAPILFHSCAPCHHPGEAAPFSLMTYADVKRRAKLIAETIPFILPLVIDPVGGMSRMTYVGVGELP